MSDQRAEEIELESNMGDIEFATENNKAAEAEFESQSDQVGTGNTEVAEDYQGAGKSDSTSEKKHEHNYPKKYEKREVFCHICDELIKGSSAYRHFKFVHGYSAEADQSLKEYVCDICSYSFKKVNKYVIISTQFIARVQKIVWKSKIFAEPFPTIFYTFPWCNLSKLIYISNLTYSYYPTPHVTIIKKKCFIEWLGIIKLIGYDNIFDLSSWGIITDI